MDAYTRQGRIASRVLHLNNELTTIEIPYLEDYGEKIHLTFNILKKGSLYQRNCTFVRKAPNKRLSMKWSTFRDRLQPGQKEEWRLTIQNPDGKSPADAEVLAMMYDASLDKISPLHQSLKVYYDSYVPADNWSTYIARRDFNFWFNTPHWRVPGWSYDQFYETHGITEVFECASIAEDSGMGRKMMMKASARANDSGAAVELKSAAPQVGDVVEAVEYEAEERGEATSSVTPRTNFNETAFFYPQLRTNKQGEVVISFTMPESLTRWKFNGWAHTKDMNIGHIEAETVTQKEFMLTPNLPRYVRVGDETVIAATIANLTDQPVKGTARMEIFLPATEKIISVKKVKFSVAGKQNQAVSFPLHATDQNDIIGIRLIADGGSYSDGEQHLMPVLSNKQQITESVTMPIRGNETKEFSLRPLFNNHAESAVNRRLTVELTGNPAWLAIQALPTLSNPTGENAISWAIAYYANSMAAHIAAGQPRIQAMIDTWRMQNADKETLVSQLEKNQELKNILLSETPWVLEADNETEQRRRLATLFDVNEMSHRTAYALNKLEQLQEDEGGWSWYPGMRINRYTTAYITELMLRLQQATGKQVPIVEKAMDYLHAEAIKEYKECLKAEKRGAKFNTPSASALEYLYLTALHGAKVPDNAVKARNYFLLKVHALIGSSHIRTKSRAAIILHHAGMRPQAAEFINSLKEHLTTTDEMGAHFAFNESPYGWGMRPVTAHVAAMEALRTITHDQALTDEMSIWLLKQKQVTVWDDPISTVDAIYALLCGNGSNLLANEGILTATIGKRVISTVSTEADAGLASVKQSFKGDEKELNAPILTLKKEDKGIAWGAVYAQYLSPIADVQQQGKELQVEKKLYVERVAADGKKSLQPIEENTQLQVGDKVVSRLVIRLDRTMDFVQLKDSRGACFEPLSQLSGYRWSNGFGYYVEIEDASTNFFFDQLGKGVYVLEHPYRVVRAGRYQAGIATLQCAYAPEMSGHSAGSMVKVK